MLTKPKLAKPPKAPSGVKYALTVPRSVLFADLLMHANLRPVMYTAYGMDYERDYAIIDAKVISFNHDSDEIFTAAFTAGRSVEEALNGFVDSMAVTARKLQRRSSLVSSQTRRPHNSNDILEDLQDYWQACRLHMASLFSFWNVENLMVQTITHELRQTGHQAMIQNLDQFIKSNETNQYVRERRCFEKIIRRFAGDRTDLNAKTASPALLVALRHHAREFGFLLTPFDHGKVISTVTLLLRVNEVQQSLNAKSNLGITFTLPDLGTPLTPKLKRLIRILEQMTFWKNERLDVLSLADARMEPLYQAAAGSIDIPIGQLFNMTSGEIEGSLTRGRLTVSRKVLAERGVAYCLVLHNGEIDFYEPSNTNETEISTLDQKSTVLQGIGASTGTARGKVRILLSTEACAQLKTGEVLVTTMTRPEMGAALDRAAAFVTDEGGLLCHAAIISREMKKPCVIATAKASKILKTGELVEVDGAKGTVKIITRSGA
jgi:phosphohistidine swiveling domain-containing protein